MQFLDAILNYLDKSSAITVFVLALLSIYLLAVLWVFFYRYAELAAWFGKEKESYEKLHMSGVSTKNLASPAISSFMNKYDGSPGIVYDALKHSVESKATRGLTFLSLVASTSPFIGLFGTVVSILETFSNLSESKSATLAVVAPAISEALVATAAGILVATFAYSFHLLLKRKGYELYNIISRQIDLILSEEKSDV